jgi:hypothetical protein
MRVWFTHSPSMKPLNSFDYQLTMMNSFIPIEDYTYNEKFATNFVEGDTLDFLSLFIHIPPIKWILRP